MASLHISLLAILFLPGHIVAADWKRIVVALNVERPHEDSPPPHNLAYFTDLPEVTDESAAFCHQCNARQLDERKAEVRSQPERLRAEVRKLGVVHGFEVFYITYYGHLTPDELEHDWWQAIIVKVGRDKYREILHYQCVNLPGISPPVIVGDLVASEIDMNDRHRVEKNYFWFDQSGPTILDLSPASEAAARVLSEAIPRWVCGDSFSVGEAFRIGAFRLNCWSDPNEPSGYGTVEVSFKVNKGKLVVSNARWISQ